MSIRYIDAGLTLLERHTTSGESDAYYGHQQRISTDNGRTWSHLETFETVVQQLDGGGIVSYPGAIHFDPTHNRRYEYRGHRTWPGMPVYTFLWEGHQHPYNDHCFASIDDGPEELLRYEDGPDFDPANPFDPAFCRTNCAYGGQGIVFGSDGTAYLPLCARTGTDDNQHNTGGLLVMRRRLTDNAWQPSNIEHLSAEQSSRGVLEPDTAVLRDGTLLTVVRGSNTKTTPGHKWFSVSTDRGRTISPLEEFRYDDGSSFYSPSSIHYFIRSSRNDKLYWLANITPGPPEGNSPRYPLYIAEINEDRLAVKQDSLILADDREPSDPDGVQLSNFNVIENRETLDFEIYMTRLGEVPSHFWQGAVYRYIFSPPA